MGGNPMTFLNIISGCSYCIKLHVILKKMCHLLSGITRKDPVEERM